MHPAREPQSREQTHECVNIHVFASHGLNHVDDQGVRVQFYGADRYRFMVVNPDNY